MQTDYDALYASDYFAHGAGKSSFPTDFPGVVASFIRAQGLAGLLDVAGGNGLLGQTVTAAGLPARSFDYRPDPQHGVMALDLTAPLPEATRTAATEGWGGNWLTTCLDALEHIAPADIASALHALNALTDEWLLVTVSHRPSSRFNRFHPSILPPATWVAMLDTAGFELVALDEPPFVKPARAGRRIADSLIAGWVSLNPFRLRDPFTSSSLLLRKREALGPREGFGARFAERHPTIGGALWQTSVPSRVPEGTVLVLVESLQVHNIVWPLLRHMPADRVRMGLRGSETGGRGLAADVIASYAAARGIAVEEVPDPAAWVATRAEGASLLLLGHEGTFGQNSLYGALAAAQAREIGLPAILLQHGIYAAPPSRSLHLFSHEVLAWSPEYRASLERAGLVRPPTFRVTGAPKFDLCANRGDLAAHLGPWVREHPRVAVIAANTHWRLHAAAQDELLAQLAAITRRHPDWLFLWKLHAVESDLDRTPIEVGPNVQFLDDYALLCMDVPLQSLIAASEALVATQSTSLLDAAVAGCPVVMVETGHPLPYARIASMPADEVRLPQSAIRASGFRDLHLAPAVQGGGTARTLEALAEIAARGVAPDPSWSPVNAIGALWLESYLARVERRRERAEGTKAASGGTPLLAGGSAAHRLENGNPTCTVLADGQVVLRANRVGASPPRLVVEGIPARAHAALEVVAHSPARPVRLRFTLVSEGGEALAGSSHDLAGEDQSDTIVLPLPEIDALRLDIGVEHPTAEGVPGGARVRLKRLTLLPR